MKTSLPAICIDGRVFGCKVGICLALMSLGVWAGTHNGWAWMTASIILLGAMFAHAVELQHQALHNTGFQSKTANRIVGTLLGIPMLVSFTEYQTSHLRHHRTLGTPVDRESFDYDYASLRNPLRLMLHLLMLRHYFVKISTVARALRGRAREERSSRIRNEYWVMLGLFGGALIVSVATHSTALLMWWVLPLFLVAAPLHVLIELPEHLGCDPAARNIFANTRTIKTNRLMRWFVNGNNYHVEHHWRAGIQVESWPTLHAMLHEEIWFLEPSYTAFYWRFLKALWRGCVHDSAFWRTHTASRESTGVTTRTGNKKVSSTSLLEQHGAGGNRSRDDLARAGSKE